MLWYACTYTVFTKFYLSASGLRAGLGYCNVFEACRPPQHYKAKLRGEEIRTVPFAGETEP